MAPVPSKLAAHKGPQDLVFFLATSKVRPAIEGLLAVLRESADGLQASAAYALTGAAETGAVAAQQASAVLKQVGALVDGALRGVAGGLLGGCGTALRAFLSADTPLHSKLPVAFVLWLLQLLYGAFVFTYLPAAGLALNSPISLVFHAFVFLTLASFIQAARTDPAGVPDTAAWRTKGQPPAALRERKRANGEARWCRWEECYKPDRAHHCRALGRVVLRMDHHCPWLNNTVGFGNHKYFFLFLLYASGACAFFGMNVFQLLVQATLPALSSFLLVGAEGLAMLLGGILGPFFLFHCWLIGRNMTTVEFMDQRRARREREQERREGKATDADADAATGSLYDIGLFRNICAVLGDNPLLWWLPVGGPAGDGLSFPVAHELAVVRAQDGWDAKLLRGPWAASVKINGTCVRVSSPISMKVGGAPVRSASPTADRIVVKDTGGAAWEQQLEAAQTETGNGKQKHGEVYVEDQQAGEEAEETDDEAPSVMEAGRLLWEMPSEFAQDLGAGCRYLGEAMAQLASEAAVRFAAVCAVGGLEEKKARRASWQRHAERSLEGLLLAAEGGGSKLQGGAGPM